MAVVTHLDDLGKRQADSVTTYLPTEVKQLLEQWAEDESRSVSSLVAYLLTQAVKDKFGTPTKHDRPT